MDDRFYELQIELKKIKWDVLGLSEVKGTGEELIKLPSGDLFFYRGHDDSTYGGVGFLVSKNFAHHIIDVGSINLHLLFITKVK